MLRNKLQFRLLTFFVIFITNIFGLQMEYSYALAADISGAKGVSDGRVDHFDVSVMASNWLKTCSFDPQIKRVGDKGLQLILERVPCEIAADLGPNGLGDNALRLSSRWYDGRASFRSKAEYWKSYPNPSNLKLSYSYKYLNTPKSDRTNRDQIWLTLSTKQDLKNGYAVCIIPYGAGSGNLILYKLTSWPALSDEAPTGVILTSKEFNSTAYFTQTGEWNAIDLDINIAPLQSNITVSWKSLVRTSGALSLSYSDSSADRITNAACIGVWMHCDGTIPSPLLDNIELKATGLSGTKTIFTDNFQLSSIPGENSSKWEIFPGYLHKIMSVADKISVKIDGKLIGQFPVKAETTLPIDSNEISNGKHNVEILLEKLGESVFSKIDEFTSFDETPIQFDLKDIDVSKYFSQVVDNFPDVNAALSSFKIGSDGMLSSIKVNSFELLSSPIKLKKDSLPISCAVVKGDYHKNVLKFNGTSSALNLNGSIEFDGLVWYETDLSISSTSKAYIEIPLKFSIGSEIFFLGGSWHPDASLSKYGYSFSGNLADAYTWARKLPEGISYHSLAACFQITDGIRGLSINLPPRAADLNLEQYDRIIEINRQGSNAVIRLHLSDGKIPVTSDKLSFGFGVQPFPFRNYDNNANFKYRIARSHSYSYLLSNRPDALPAFANGGTKYMVHHEWWNEHQSYYTILNEKERFRQLLADTHKYNIGYLPYFGFQISEKAPEFELYYPHISDGLRYSPYIASLVPPAKSYSVCYASIWGDQWLRGIKEFIQEYPVDGIYMDGTLGLNACFNSSHGHLTKDSRGRFVPYFTTKEKRRFALLLHKMARGVRPNLVLDQHTDMAAPITMSLVDVFWVGEQVWAFDSDWKVPVDVYRTVFNSRLYGVPIQQLSNLGYINFMRDLGVTLLLDSIPRPMEGLGDWQFNAFKLWKIFDDYNLKGEYFIPFYSQNAVYKDVSGKALISYYDTPNHVVLVVSNYEGLQPINAEIDFNSTPLEASSLSKDLLTNEVFSISSKKLYVPIITGSFRILHILK